MIDLLIPAAQAAEAGGGGGIPFGFDIFIIVAFVLVFYFLIWRPQSKQAKEHRDLVSSVAKGDEIVTRGGLLGRVVRVEEQYIEVEIANNTEIKLQKAAVAAMLPKGTIKQI